MKEIISSEFAQRIEKLAVYVILLLVLAFMLMLCIAACTETSYLNTNHISGENIDIYSDNMFLNIILLVLYLAAAYLFYHCTDSLSQRGLELGLYGWMFVFGCLFIMTTKLAAPVYSDSFILTNSAMEAAEGYYDSMGGYFARFPFQLGYVLYCELLFRVMFILLPGLPEGYYCLALQGANLVWLMLCYFALLRIVVLLSGSARVHKLTMLLMFVSLQPLMSCTFLYGNIPALGCGAVALWMFVLFVQRGGLHHALFCALALSFAVALKLNMMIFLVAICGVWLVLLVKKFSFKSLVCMALTLLCVLSLSKLPQQIYEKRSGLEFGEGIPMVAWLAMGVSEGHAGPGWYREDNTVQAFKDSDGDVEFVAQNAKNVIAQRAAYFAAQPGEALRFFSEKLRSQWNEPSYDSIWLNQVFLSYSEKGGLYTLLCDKWERLTLGFMNQQQQIVFLGMLIGTLALLKKKDILSCTLPLVILGGLLYHLLFEAKSQYSLPYFVLMLPVAALGLGALFDYIKIKKPMEADKNGK